MNKGRIPILVPILLSISLTLKCPVCVVYRTITIECCWEINSDIGWITSSYSISISIRRCRCVIDNVRLIHVQNRIKIDTCHNIANFVCRHQNEMITVWCDGPRSRLDDCRNPNIGSCRISCHCCWLNSQSNGSNRVLSARCNHSTPAVVPSVLGIIGGIIIQNFISIRRSYCRIFRNTELHTCPTNGIIAPLHIKSCRRIIDKSRRIPHEDGLKNDIIRVRVGGNICPLC
ncbi:hypothetical protein LAHI110946_12655 [Lactococcus hircilactis]